MPKLKNITPISKKKKPKKNQPFLFNDKPQKILAHIDSPNDKMPTKNESKLK